MVGKVFLCRFGCASVCRRGAYLALWLAGGMALAGCAGLVSKTGGSASPNAPQQGQAVVATPSSVTFGSVSIGSTNSQTIQLSNTSASAVTVTTVAASGAGISTSGISLPMTLNPGSSTTFTAGFSPKTAGTVSGNISVTDSGDRSPVMIASTATGVTNSLKLSSDTTAVNFADVTIGTTMTRNVTLTNQGSGDVKISSVSATGAGFSVGAGTQLTLTPGQSAPVQVAFNPASAGAKSGMMSVISNANSPLNIGLSGSGVDASKHSVLLKWAPSTSAVAGYFVYRGGQSGGPYSRLNPAVSVLTDYTDATLGAGQTYFYVVTAVDSSNVESVHSNEVQVAIP